MFCVSMDKEINKEKEREYSDVFFDQSSRESPGVSGKRESIKKHSGKRRKKREEETQYKKNGNHGKSRIEEHEKDDPAVKREYFFQTRISVGISQDELRSD